MQKQNGLKTLNILHKALLMGQVFFAAVCFYVVYTRSILPPAQELEKTLQVIALILAVTGVFAGMSFFKRKLLQIREIQTGTKEKFAMYRSASVVQWALLEGPSLFCITCLFLTGNYAFLALAIVIMFLFVLMAPSKNKIIVQLQISESEMEEL